MSTMITQRLNPPLHIILFQPEIPQNTGNIGRTALILNARLHLIHPLGFELSEKKVRRAGLDYWKDVDLVEHKDWEAFVDSPHSPKLSRIFALTTKSQTSIWECSFKLGDGLLFGQETKGLPEHIHQELWSNRITLPHPNANTRSLNLATAVAISGYEHLRQVITH